MDFPAFISALGFEPPERLEPGRIARFSTNGRRGDDAGWALLFPDGDGGIVGDWRSGEQQVWQAEKVSTYTPEQKLNWQRAVETARAEAAASRRKDYDATAIEAAQLWALSTPTSAPHGYLSKKGVQAHGLRLYKGSKKIGGMVCDGALLIAARNVGGLVRSLQFVDELGEKRYLPGGEITGHFFTLGRITGNNTICIVEGYATGASVHEATGCPVAVAFDAGNLMPVCKALRDKYPEARIVICADNDVGVKAGKVENPGVTRANEAATAVRASVVVPELDGTKCDWNDLYVRHGKEPVRLAVNPPTATMTGPGVVRSDDSAFLRHMIEAEGRAISRVTDFGAKMRERLAGRIQRLGCKLPWAKTHGDVILRPKEVSIWAGINGHGKSALLNQVALDLMRQGQKVFVASLEMPVESTLERMVRQASGVSQPAPDYVDAFEAWANERLYLYDHVGRESPKKMVAMLKYVHEKTGCQHLIVDSMMKVVRSPDDYAGQKDFIDLLCAASHDLGVHIHVVAHSRKRESEFDQIDKFDVKGASEIADQVDNLFTVFRNKRKEVELAKGGPDAGRWLKVADTVLTVAKQRHGDWEGAINLFYADASKTYHETEFRTGWQISFKDMGIDEVGHVPF